MKTQMLLVIVLAINSFHSANIECQKCNLDDKALNSASIVTTDSCPHNFNEYCQIFAKTCANQIQKCFPKLTKSINMFKDWPRSQVFIYYGTFKLKSYENPECLGTLLSPKLVLTSASCILGCLQIFGLSVDENYCPIINIRVAHAKKALIDDTRNWIWIKINDFKLRPKFNTEPDIYSNVALLRLDQKVATKNGITKLSVHRPQDVPG